MNKYAASFDWNMDGKIDEKDVPYEVMNIQWQIANEKQERRCSKMARAIAENHLAYVNNEIFERLCDLIGIPMSEFKQEDIEIIRDKVERM